MRPGANAGINLGRPICSSNPSDRASMRPGANAGINPLGGCAVEQLHVLASMRPGANAGINPERCNAAPRGPRCFNEARRERRDQPWFKVSYPSQEMELQ